MTPRAAIVAEIPNASAVCDIRDRARTLRSFSHMRSNGARFSSRRNPLLSPCLLIHQSVVGKLPARLHAGATTMIETSYTYPPGLIKRTKRAINANEGRNKATLHELCPRVLCFAQAEVTRCTTLANSPDDMVFRWKKSWTSDRELSVIARVYERVLVFLGADGNRRII